MNGSCGIGRAGLLACACFVLAAVGCSTPHRFLEPDHVLDRSLEFRERSGHGAVFELSRLHADSAAVTRVPRPAQVDLDSRIEVSVRRTELAPSGDAREPTDELEQRIDAMTRVLASLDEFLARREDALRAYAEYLRSPSGTPAADEALDTFDRIRAAMARAESEWTTILIDEFPEREEEYEAAALDLMSGALRDLLEAELFDLAAQFDALQESASFRLRLEAFLDSPGAGTVALHVPGYDTLPQGSLERRDRWGLALEGAEKQRFERLARHAEQVAAAAQRVHQRSDSLRALFAELSTGPAAPLAALGLLATELARELEGPQLQARIDATAAAADAFAFTLPTVFLRAAETQWRQLRAQLDGFVAGLRADLLAAPQLARIIGSLGEFEAALGTLGPAQVLDAVQAARELAIAIRALFPLRLQLEVPFDAALDAAVRQASGLPEQTATHLRQAWEASALRGEMLGWQQLGEQIEEFVRRLESIPRLDALRPVPFDLRVPEALEILVADAPDTFVDLERTPRLDGDRLTLRGTLLDAQGQPRHITTATFDIRRFGWHARLDPSVVLARPERFADARPSFNFAPAVSWLHTYRPRPHQSGPFDHVWRATGFSAGLHAVFLDADPDKELEIGLGLTAALWNGVLQAGAGRSLFAEGRDDGALYYFVGSSLIAALQHFGAGTASSAD